jgi:hypothetical protein
VLVTPFGGWVMFRLEADLVVETFDLVDSKIVTYELALGSGGALGESFVLRGEPSAGTWTLVLFDVTRDSNIARLVTSEVTSPTTLAPNTPASLALAGVS